MPWWERSWELNKMELARPLLGMAFSGSERNNVFFSREGTKFLELAGVSGVDDPDDPMGFAYLDYDRDGCMDIALTTREFPGFELFQNNLCRASGRNSISVRLVGGNRGSQPSSEYSSRDGIGARVTAMVDGRKIMRELRAGEGWRTQNTSTVMIGIGTAETADRLSVRWPSGKEQVFENVPSRGALFVYENPAESPNGSGLEVRAFDFGPRRGVASSRIENELPLAPAEDSELTMFVAMATWCASCKRELPNLGRLREAFEEDELSLMGVPIDPEDDQEKLGQYVSEHRPAYDLMDELTERQRSDFKEFCRRQIGTDALPATVIARRDGTVLFTQPGIPTLSEIRRLLR